MKDVAPRWVIYALALLLLVGFVGLAAQSANAATPKTYWTTEKAEVAVTTLRPLTKVRIPYCTVFPQSARCEGGGGPGQGFYTADQVLCTGADELRQTFRFARFSCRFVLKFGYATGTLTLIPTGKTTYRWKLVSLARA